MKVVRGDLIKRYEHIYTEEEKNQIIESAKKIAKQKKVDEFEAMRIAFNEFWKELKEEK